MAELHVQQKHVRMSGGWWVGNAIYGAVGPARRHRKPVEAVELKWGL